MYLKTKSGKLVELPSPEEDEKITAAALSDPDALPLTDEEWADQKSACARWADQKPRLRRSGSPFACHRRW
ncbi:hypothetical protein ATG98_4152 [Marinobacter sp. LV10R520-4]|nr:hypothetical protein ATG98_4152 [Marinobacter sp. LV10R520-4]